MLNLAPPVPDATLLMMLGAGLMAFLSPCVLPMLPVYALYLFGANSESGEKRAAWSLVLRRCLGLALSFILLFTLIGAGAGLIGDWLKHADRRLLGGISGALLILFGLWTLGLIQLLWTRLKALANRGVQRIRESGFWTRLKASVKRVKQRIIESRPWTRLLRHKESGKDRQKGSRKERKPGMTGFWSSFAFGLLLALSWTPCITPLLANALILAASAENATMLTGMGHLAVFALGLALPMLVFMLLYQWLKGAVAWLRIHQLLIRRVGGGLMVAYGLYIVIAALI